jgi:hypothetical protein
VKNYGLILLIFMGLGTTACKNPAPTPPVYLHEALPPIDTLILSDQKVVIHLGQNGLPTMIYPLDEKQILNGTAVEFRENGGLLSVSHWKDGMKEGSAWAIGEEQIIHQLFCRGKLIYEANYLEREKFGNKLYPTVVEEFFFEDKYYSKIRFPMPYPGKVKLDVLGYQSVISPLPDQTFQLVINDALDLTEYNLELTYQPAVQDSILGVSYTYKHVVYEE